MTFRILARSNIKDSMTFLMAEPPLRRPDQQRCQGDPAHRNVPARICTASEGIKLPAPGASWLPSSRCIWGRNSPGDSLPANGGTQGGWQRPSRWVPQASRRGAKTRSRGTTSLPRAGRSRAHTLCAQASGLSTLAASQRRRQPIKSAGTNKGGVDSKAAFLRLSQAAVHSRAADSGCSIQADFQDGRIRP